MDSLLLLALVGAALIGFVGFFLGDRRRRSEGGGARGPRPSRSIGAALEEARLGSGRALLLFLGEDPQSAAAGEALRGELPVLELLGQPGLSYVILSGEREGEDLMAHLYEKYQGGPLPGLPAAILVEGDGQVRAEGPLQASLSDQLQTWLRLPQLPPKAPPPE